MVTIVVALNMLISLVLLFVALRVQRLRLRFAMMADALTVAERIVHRVLYKSPECIYARKGNFYNLRQNYQILEIQIQNLQQIFDFLYLAQRIYRRYGSKRTRSSVGSSKF
ncbi:MAG: hypothetical protein KME64_05705 [Scytonematopsis contorta HA4267-MV1]|jgi:predicted acyltransferase|nr:hypothetical protein [Scytonematopsis contorta HA4267-MV1]